jgi:hypothetical protein
MDGGNGAQHQEGGAVLQPQRAQGLESTSQAETVLAPIRNYIVNGPIFSPTEMISSFVPHLNIFGRSFIPDSAIPDLAGRVILVTGGRLLDLLEVF